MTAALTASGRRAWTLPRGSTVSGYSNTSRCFAKNAIDDAVLLELTADDLKDLGVSLVGHRRKLFAAIAALRSESGSEPREEAGDVTDTFLACGLNVSCGYRSSAGNEMEDLGPQPLAGFAEPLRAWLVAGESEDLALLAELLSQ